MNSKLRSSDKLGFNNKETEKMQAKSVSKMNYSRVGPNSKVLVNQGLILLDEKIEVVVHL